MTADMNTKVPKLFYDFVQFMDYLYGHPKVLDT